MFGNRPLLTVLSSIFQKRHYIALWNMYRIYPAFRENLKRYLLGKGKYPYKIQIRTPIGLVHPTLYSHHDLLTVNEVFCRQDYRVNNAIDVAVDLGSNIGISALYFMTRNNKSKCYLFEPYNRNVERLRLNLAGFEPRYLVREKAVSDVSGRFRFGVEPTGRYGGLEIETGQYLEIDCLGINEVLQEVLETETIIDVLKIDIEGVEIRTVKAIRRSILERIRKIYIDSNPKEKLHPSIFEQRQYRSICQLTNKVLGS